MPRRRVFACAFLLAAGVASAADQRWKIQYFYDENQSALTLLDIRFSSARHGVAIGYLEDNKIRPVVLVTDDAGAHWSLVKTKEAGASVFLLNDTIGWIAGAKRVWKTADGGRTWRGQQALKDLQSIYFVSAERGWAAAGQKHVYETKDGGEHWVDLAAAAQPNSNPDYTTYGWIDFADARNGIISGWSLPSRDGSSVPDWMTPETSAKRREIPRLSIVLETRDGGDSWTPSTTSIFGRLSRVRFSRKGFALGLIEFTDSFDWPSEVFHIDWGSSGSSRRVYREKNRLITDVAALGSGTAFLAGIEKADKIPNSPIPGKVKLLASSDLSSWEEMDVDYRATAHRVMLAAVDEENAWAATDTGMILKLTAK